MKRALVLIIIVIACVAGFLSMRGVMPFMAIFGTSMEPVLYAGNLVLIKSVSPADVKVGDIIVFTVPPAIREHYNYPPVVAHRVLKVQTTATGVVFRTKGDNSGEDPFSVRPEDLLGQVSQQIPYLGFPILFFQSQQGFIFIIAGLSLLALYLYSDELSRGRRALHRGIFAPVIEENHRAGSLIEQRLEASERGMEYTQQALNNFAAAVAEYAEHLKSHTAAIQGLSEASQELKKSAAEQNRVLLHLMERMEQAGSKAEKPEIKELPPEERKPRFPPGCVRSPRDHSEKQRISRAG